MFIPDKSEGFTQAGVEDKKAALIAAGVRVGLVALWLVSLASPLRLREVPPRR